MSNNQGAILVIFSGIFWGFNGPCIEFLTQINHVNLDAIIAYRFLIAGTLMLMLGYYKNLFTTKIFKNKKHLISLISFTIFGIFFSQYFYFYGVMLSNSAIATIIQFSAPVFIILIVCYEEKRIPTIKEFLAFILVFLGAFLLVTNGHLDKILITPFALLMCILSMVGFVANSIIPRKINTIYSPIFVLGISMSICGIVFFVSKGVWDIEVTLNLQILLAFFTILLFGTMFPFIFYMTGVNKIGAAKSTILSSSVPIVATLISHFWLKTSLGYIQILGFLLIFIAILITIIKKLS
ncbi:DMT family transporter [Campylobacter sp. MG1]|uniref:DMT family transporter n=1 Tax=Campylobacter sp. MG1 TaxID=2976332 RepID=UPI00226C820B|nr:DMT family transporter [Campylobacter sp. MG1]